MRIFFLVDGSFLFFCSALSILNYNVNIDVQLHLINSTETDFKAFSLLECAMYASFNVYLSAGYDSKTKTCVLSNSHFLTTVPSTGSYVLQLLGKEHPIYDCSELPLNSTSGIYQIKPKSDYLSINVFCEMTITSGGWTVISRKLDGSVDFDRIWQDYKTGFGNLSGEFWLGNENLYQITTRTQYQVRIDLVDIDGKTAYALYSTFGVANETNSYTLNLSGYSGTAGDSMLNYHLGSLSGRPFVTRDRQTGCPTSRKSGWWYWGCSQCNVLGLYNPGAWGEQYMIWKTWRSRYGLSRITMMIKPYP